MGFGPAVDAPRVEGFAASAAFAGGAACVAPCAVDADVVAGAVAPKRAVDADDVGAVVADVAPAVAWSLSFCPEAKNRFGVGAAEEAAEAVGFVRVKGLADVVVAGD